MNNVTRYLVPQGGAMLANLGKLNFDAVSLQTLQTRPYTMTPINGSNNASNQLTAGTVVAIKTGAGRYAKMKINTLRLQPGHHLGDLQVGSDRVSPATTERKRRKTTRRGGRAEYATATPPEPRRRPRRIALLMGNERVRDESGEGFALALTGIERDLADMADVLGEADCGGFEVVSHREPTLMEARLAIARAASELEAEDTLLVYYSGTSHVGSGGQLYLPVSDSSIRFLDATCLDSEYVLSCLRRCGSRRQVLLIDGCHSGAFFVNNRGIPDGFAAITACGPDEVCYGDANGGFFTRLLVEGLRGATADLDGDGVVTTDELFRYVLPRARRQEHPTTPQMWSWNLPEPIPLVAVRQQVFNPRPASRSGHRGGAAAPAGGGWLRRVAGRLSGHRRRKSLAPGDRAGTGECRRGDLHALPAVTRVGRGLPGTRSRRRAEQGDPSAPSRPVAAPWLVQGEARVDRAR